MQNPSVELMKGRSPRLTAVFHSCEEEGGFIGECLEIPGCMAQGETSEEVEANLREAINDCLLVMFEDLLKEAACSRDLGTFNFTRVSRQETLTVRAPQLMAAEACV
jgi:predicted RNase H-like HicB family nuclease